MTSTTDPTVPLPTATDTDDDDDDDDDVSSSLIPGQPPAATSSPIQPSLAPAPAPVTTVAETAVPGAPPSPTAAAPFTPSSPSSLANPTTPTISSQTSVTGLADSLPSGSPSTLPHPGLTDRPNSGGDGLSPGASAGIGIGVALVVCLAAFGIWFFVRRRKSRRTKTRSASSHSSDEEHIAPAPKSEVYAYRADRPTEISGDEKPRRWSELESPTYVSEVGDGQVFRAELPGSVVPALATSKGDSERLFTDAPIDEVAETDESAGAQEVERDKKSDERLFSDSPIDTERDTLGVETSSKTMKKRG